MSKSFVTKTDVLRYLEDGMGSEGSTLQAEKMFTHLKQTGHLTFEDDGLFWLCTLNDQEFIVLWAQALFK